jgi:hypothetical protein
MSVPTFITPFSSARNFMLRTGVICSEKRNHIYFGYSETTFKKNTVHRIFVDLKVGDREEK